MAETTGQPDIVILGQTIRYPGNLHGAVAIFVVMLGLSVTILTGLYLMRHLTPAQLKSVSSLFGQIRVPEDSASMKVKGGFRVEFWTPSVFTKEGLGGPENDASRAWQVHDETNRDISELNLRFGEQLSRDSRVKGFRRYEVTGHGKTGLKRGWWWVISIQGTGSGEFAEWLARQYRDVWGSPVDNAIYIEVVGSLPVGEEL